MIGSSATKPSKIAHAYPCVTKLPIIVLRFPVVQMRKVKKRAKDSAPPRPRGLATRERILDAAEKLFATEGLDTSLRSVMEEAKVNVASIHYYFGTNEVLLEEVIKRRAVAINRERIKRLEEAMQTNPPEISEILRALMEPAFELAMEREPSWGHYFQLLGRLDTSAQDVYSKIMAKYYSKTHAAFFKALQQALPSLAPETLVWRYHCVVSVMSLSFRPMEMAKNFPTIKIQASRAEDVLKQLVPPLAALIRSGAPG
jgi:AcrR family transcriptional regulator